MLGNLVTAVAEMPGVVLGILAMQFLSRRLAYILPLAFLIVPLIPMMAGVTSTAAVMVCMFLSRVGAFTSFNALFVISPEL